MKRKIAFVIAALFWGSCESKVVKCHFDVDTFSGADYYCSVQSSFYIISKNDREITQVEGYHKEGKSNDDVKLFHSASNKIKFFPRGIEKFFKNIEWIQIYVAQLEEISKEDLKPFGDKLKVLKLLDNKISRIEADLFEFNPNLEKLYLRGNEITHIEDGTFYKLEKLHTLNLDYNQCTPHYDQAEDDRPKVLSLICKAECKCKDPKFTTTTTTTAAPTTTSTTTTTTTTTQSPIIEGLNQKISSLKLNLTSKLEILKLRNNQIEILRSENKYLNAKCEGENIEKVIEKFFESEVAEKLSALEKSIKEKFSLIEEILEEQKSCESQEQSFENINEKMDQMGSLVEDIRKKS